METYLISFKIKMMKMKYVIPNQRCKRELIQEMQPRDHNQIRSLLMQQGITFGMRPIHLDRDLDRNGKYER